MISTINSFEKIEGMKSVPVITMIIAVISFVLAAVSYFIGKETVVLGLLLGAFMSIISLLTWLYQVVQHKITIKLSSGEQKSFVNKEIEYINNIEKALMKAIIFRG